MADPSPVLVLTRPDHQSRTFLADCQARLGRDISSVISPALQIKPVTFDLDLDEYRTLIVTSRNTLDQVGISLEGRDVATVGQRTAGRAAEMGAKAVCLGETVEAFLENANDLVGPAVHLRGVHSRGALAERLARLGQTVTECVVYDQVERPLSEAAITALQTGSAIVPVFSPRTAAIVSRHVVHPDTRVFVISDATSKAWTGSGEIAVAERPDKQAMLDLVVGAF